MAAPADSNINRSLGLQYWNDVPATVGGMTGGFPVSRIDLRGSKSFLTKVRRLRGNDVEKKLRLGVDCGAGIGRVTNGVLSQVCEVVDAVEPVEKFAQVLRDTRLNSNGVGGDIYNVGLEDWHPEKRYDLIWVQWCVGHLTDRQLVEFMIRCRDCLTEDGLVVFKENNTSKGFVEDIYDEEDSAVTRTHEKFLTLFAEAGMDLIATELQSGFPKRLELLPVRFYALRPMS
ncbi:hypothetical protein EYZ11_009023 [Aspergillus tanneri]|nr:hypothetical protein EYZ11_009023 [Aspergillus tanneri]